MTSSFDGSTPTGTDYASRADSDSNGSHAAQAVPFGQYPEDKPASLLELLRERVSERDSEEVEPWEHEITTIGVKIVCDPVINNHDYQRWIKASMPRRKGQRQAQPSAMDMDQLSLSARAIVHTNLRIELYNQKTKAWNPITDQSGETLTAMDKDMCAAFNVMDPIELMRKLFGRDATLIDAGNSLLAAAGYLDGDADDDNPL